MELRLVADSGAHQFRGGVIVLSQGTLLRTPAFSPYITDYHHQVFYGDNDYSTHQFRAGSVRMRTHPYDTVLLVGSTSHQFSEGQVTFDVSSAPLIGAVSKFAVWPTATAVGDPADFLVDQQSTVTAGGVQQPWARSFATVHPKPSAQYLGVGTRWPGVLSSPQSGYSYRQYLRKVQVERAAVGGSYPSTYEKARQVHVVVKPDAVNLFPNPSAEVNVTGTGTDSTGQVVTQSSTYAWAGTQSFRHETQTGGAATYKRVFQNGLSVPAGATVRIKVRFKMSTATAGKWTGKVEARFHDEGTLTTYDTVTGITPEAPDVDGWWTINVIHTVPVTRTLTKVYFDLVATGLANTDMAYFDGWQCTKGTEDVPYFDGSSNNDTLWEGTVGNSRSYYYQDRVARYAAIKRILETNVPMGIGVGEPEFATLPANYW